MVAASARKNATLAFERYLGSNDLLPINYLLAGDAQWRAVGRTAVFNNEWQVISLHSAGVAKADAAGHYLDKDGQVIEVENGRIDKSRVVWLTNRRVRVSAIMRHLLAPESAVALHLLIEVFSSLAHTESRPFTGIGSVRINVISSPVFQNDDPVYASVQVAFGCF